MTPRSVERRSCRDARRWPRPQRAVTVLLHRTCRSAPTTPTTSCRGVAVEASLASQVSVSQAAWMPPRRDVGVDVERRSTGDHPHRGMLVDPCVGRAVIAISQRSDRSVTKAGARSSRRSRRRPGSSEDHSRGRRTTPRTSIDPRRRWQRNIRRRICGDVLGLADALSQPVANCSDR